MGLLREFEQGILDNLRQHAVRAAEAQQLRKQPLQRLEGVRPEYANLRERGFPGTTPMERTSAFREPQFDAAGEANLVDDIQGRLGVQMDKPIEPWTAEDAVMEAPSGTTLGDALSPESQAAMESIRPSLPIIRNNPESSSMQYVRWLQTQAEQQRRRGVQAVTDRTGRAPAGDAKIAESPVEVRRSGETLWKGTPSAGIKHFEGISDRRAAVGGQEGEVSRMSQRLGLLQSATEGLDTRFRTRFEGKDLPTPEEVHGGPEALTPGNRPGGVDATHKLTDSAYRNDRLTELEARLTREEGKKNPDPDLIAQLNQEMDQLAADSRIPGGKSIGELYAQAQAEIERLRTQLRGNVSGGMISGEGGSLLPSEQRKLADLKAELTVAERPSLPREAYRQQAENRMFNDVSYSGSKDQPAKKYPPLIEDIRAGRYRNGDAPPDYTGRMDDNRYLVKPPEGVDIFDKATGELTPEGRKWAQREAVAYRTLQGRSGSADSQKQAAMSRAVGAQSHVEQLKQKLGGGFYSKNESRGIWDEANQITGDETYDDPALLDALTGSDPNLSEFRPDNTGLEAGRGGFARDPNDPLSTEMDMTSGTDPQFRLQVEKPLQDKVALLREAQAQYGGDIPPELKAQYELTPEEDQLWRTITEDKYARRMDEQRSQWDANPNNRHDLRNSVQYRQRKAATAWNEEQAARMEEFSREHPEMNPEEVKRKFNFVPGVSDSQFVIDPSVRTNYKFEPRTTSQRVRNQEGKIEFLKRGETPYGGVLDAAALPSSRNVDDSARLEQQLTPELLAERQAVLARSPQADAALAVGPSAEEIMRRRLASLQTPQPRRPWEEAALSRLSQGSPGDLELLMSAAQEAGLSPDALLAALRGQPAF